MKQDCEVLLNNKVNSICYYMELNAPGVIEKAMPGQFFQVQVEKGLSPLLRRPISINEINKEKGTMGFLYQVKGKGTELLREKKPGDKVNILGPLGNGFNTKPAGENILVIGGGIGIAPLYPLVYALRSLQKNVTVLIGARTKEMILCREKFLNLGCSVLVSTDDGSYGKKGYVSQLLIDYLKTERPDFVYLCGPEVMLAGIERICLDNALSGQVSIEARMGCGIGACLCCSHEKAGDQGSKYVKVCVDGPVFGLGEVKLNGAG